MLFLTGFSLLFLVFLLTLTKPDHDTPLFFVMVYVSFVGLCLVLISFGILISRSGILDTLLEVMP